MATHRIKKLLALFFSISTLGFSSIAGAQTVSPHLLIHNAAQKNYRAMAMGNAYTAIARGEGALLYNPAGLAQYDMDVKVEVSLDAEGPLQFVQDTTAFLASGSPTGIATWLNTYEGTTQVMRIQNFQSAVANLGTAHLGFGFGKLDDRSYTLTFANPNMTYGSTHLAMTPVGMAFQMWDGKLMLGALNKNFSYTLESQTINYTTLLTTGLNPTPLSANISGNLVDIGLLYRMESFSTLRAQWGLSILNYGKTSLTASNGTSYTVPLVINAGLTFGPKAGPFEWLISADIEDLSNTAQIYDPVTSTLHKRAYTQNIHLGTELGFFKTATGNHIINLRAGANRGLTTYGWEINFIIGSLAYTYFQDDLGYNGTRNIQRNGIYHLAFGFAF